MEHFHEPKVVDIPWTGITETEAKQLEKALPKKDLIDRFWPRLRVRDSRIGRFIYNDSKSPAHHLPLLPRKQLPHYSRSQRLHLRFARITEKERSPYGCPSEGAEKEAGQKEGAC